MGHMCACYGIKLAVVGAVLVANNQGWIWNAIDPWLLVGILLVVLGVLKAVWPCCPVHCKPGEKMAVKPARKGR